MTEGFAYSAAKERFVVVKSEHYAAPWPKVDPQAVAYAIHVGRSPEATADTLPADAGMIGVKLIRRG